MTVTSSHPRGASDLQGQNDKIEGGAEDGRKAQNDRIEGGAEDVGEA